MYGSELYSLIDNAVNGKDYDVLSAASISVVNDLAGDVQKFLRSSGKTPVKWTKNSCKSTTIS